MTKAIKKSYFIFIPLLITVFAMLLGIVRYGAVDDILMYNMATSYTFNTHSEQLMFLNIGFGFLLKFLYSLTGVVNWFSLLYLVLFNLAFAVLFKILEKREASIIYVIILAGVDFFLLTRISFTVISFLLAAAGVLWLISNVEKLNKKSIPHIIFGTLLLILAFMSRSGSTLYCMLLIFIPLLVFGVIKKRNSAAVVSLIIVISIISNFGVTAIHKQYNKTIPSEMYFSEFQKYRSAASDEGKINYKKHKKKFKEAGISANDLSIYKQFVYGDKEAYSAEKLKVIKDTRDFKDKYNINVIKIVKNIYKLENPIVNYIFCLAGLAVILFIIYKKQRLEILSSAAFTGLAELYLFVRRRGVVRVTDPIAALGIILLIYIVCGEKERIKELKPFKIFDYKRFFPIIVSLVLVFTVLLSAVCFKTYDKKYVDYSDTVNCIEEDGEHVYLAAPLSADKLYDQHLTLLSSQYENVPVYTPEGDWFIYSYYWYALLDRLEMTEYKDNAINTILCDDVRFISRNKDLPDYLVKYYKEHYKLKVKYELVNEFSGGMKVYEFKVKR